MSDLTENTQPIKATQPVDTGDSGTTQEMKPAKKKSRGFLRFLLNLLIFLVIIGLGIFGGYQSGIGIRKNAEKSLVNQQLSDQFSRAIVDIQFGNYSAAQQRLEYILGIDPGFPGVMEKLTEVMVMSNIPTVTPEVSPTPELIVVDDTDYEGMFAQAQQLIAAGQWQNAMTVLGTLRLKDVTFRTVQVDGMYYFALRNLGIEFIQAGNLEGGIYELTLAERFAPLDNTAHVLRESARAYINASSFWELDWQRAAEGFYNLNGSGMWDGTMTGTERLRIAAMRYGDELFARSDFCGAYEWYQTSLAAGGLDEVAARNANEAYSLCYPPTATPVPTTIATESPVATEAPPVATEPSPAEPSP